MAEGVGYAVAVLMLLIGVTVIVMSMRASLRSGQPGWDPAQESVDEGRLTHRLTA